MTTAANYFQMGFYFTEEESDPKRLCEIYNDVSANRSLKPSLLLRHLDIIDPAHRDKLLECFKRKLAGNKKCSVSSVLSATNEHSKIAFEVIELQNLDKLYTVSENFIGPYTKEITKRMLWRKSDK